jgi:hypothetical protein
MTTPDPTTLTITAADLDADGFYTGTENVSHWPGAIVIEADLGTVRFRGTLRATTYIKATAGSGIVAGSGIEAGEGIKAGLGIEVDDGIKAG